jgi:molecular chaperone GrpE (heat shock protein)
MSSAEELWNDLESALEALHEAAATLQVKLPKVRKAYEKAAEATEQLQAARRQLESLEARLEKYATALAELESCVLDSIQDAQAYLHDHSIPVAERERLLDLVRKLFRPLERAGFQLIVPSIGDTLDDERHAVKGRARSPFGAQQIADIVAWGYRFPSGEERKAEVLVGDGSVMEQPAELEPEPAAPAPKEGITMVLDPAGPAKKAKPPGVASEKGTSLFEKLEEAAKRNRGETSE